MKRLILTVLATTVLFSLMTIPAFAGYKNVNVCSRTINGIHAEMNLYASLTKKTTSVTYGKPYIRAFTEGHNSACATTNAYFLRATVWYKVYNSSTGYTTPTWQLVANNSNTGSGVYRQQAIWDPTCVVNYTGASNTFPALPYSTLYAMSEHKLRPYSSSSDIIIETLSATANW